MNIVRMLMDSREDGFSMIELITVVGIIFIMLGIAAMYGKPWMDRYNVEGQIRKMHADLTQTRARAMERNHLYFVVVGGSSYQVIEDTNDSLAQDASPADTYLPAVPLKYQVLQGAQTITMDQRGIITVPTSTVVRFDTGSGTPEVDCIDFSYPTRINIGRMNGASCLPR